MIVSAHDLTKAHLQPSLCANNVYVLNTIEDASEKALKSSQEELYSG